MNLYVCADTGPSGFGVASRGLIRQLIPVEDINLTVRSHFWGLNRVGIHFSNRSFPDKRFQERLLTHGHVNDEHLIEDPREMADRSDVDLLEDLGSNVVTEPEECMIREFDGEEDVWLGVGGMSFAEQAPDHAYTIVSTDYNLDIVPREWEYYIDQVDEVWVPSEWTRQAVIERVPQAEGRVFALPYGVDMRYKPTEYDCEVCPHNRQGQPMGGQPDPCLRDDSFTFLIVSRFYHIKGLYRTLKAYIEEFRKSDDVRLFIKTTANNQFQFDPARFAQEVVDELQYPDYPEIGFAMNPLETQYLYDLLGHCDAFLQVSRAECFGIAQMQAAWCGTPVVYTNWSAQEELLDAGNPGMFPVLEFEVEKPRQEFRWLPFEVSDGYPPDSQWASPSVAAIRERMRELVEMDDEERTDRGHAAKRYVDQTFRWQDRIEPRIERLREVTG